MKVHVITAMYNNEPNIARCIRSLRSQTCDAFQCILIDDLSTDRTVERAREAIGDDPRLRLIVNTTKKFKARNVTEGIAAANPAPDDVIALVDGDDMLAGDGALEVAAKTYRDRDCWMTYGSYRDGKGVRGRHCRAYDPPVIRSNRYRSTRWIASHLKTFKHALWQRLAGDTFEIADREVARAKLRALAKGRLRSWLHWRHVRRADLVDPSGKYLRRCDDKAFSYPMLEMSGERAVFIPDILYVYGSQDDFVEPYEPVYGTDRSETWLTRLIRDIIVHRPAYTRLTGLDRGA